MKYIRPWKDIWMIDAFHFKTDQRSKPSLLKTCPNVDWRLCPGNGPHSWNILVLSLHGSFHDSRPTTFSLTRTVSKWLTLESVLYLREGILIEEDIVILLVSYWNWFVILHRFLATLKQCNFEAYPPFLRKWLNKFVCQLVGKGVIALHWTFVGIFYCLHWKGRNA